MSRNAIVIAIGKKGAGKSTRVQRIAAKCRRSFVVDPEMSWPAGPRDMVFDNGAELVRYARVERLYDPRRKFRIVYRDQDRDRMIVDGAGVGFAVRNCTVVVDELAWLCSARVLPERLRFLPQFGRSRRVNLLGTSREPQEIHDLLLSQADLLLLFRVDPGNGMDRLRRRYGDLVDGLSELPLYRCREYGDAGALAFFGREGLDLAN